VFPVRYELGFYIPEDGILHSRRRENLKPYNVHLFLKKGININKYIFLWHLKLCSDIADISFNSLERLEFTLRFCILFQTHKLY
jgi:hypothetical protein